MATSAERSPSESVLGRELSSFVGRQHELASVARLLAAAPLVTLAGPGGAGKTRLAMRLAREATRDSHGASVESVALVELARVDDPLLLPRAVAASLRMTEDSDQPLLYQLINAVGARRLLLVLDNCEHLAATCADLVDVLLRACAHLRVLATSRQPLGVEGEVVFRVPPLGLPVGTSLDACASSEAVQLFMQRAQAVRGDFLVDEFTAPTVAQLCRRLAGMPLAIELAAARMATLPLADIALLLDQDPNFLRGGHRTAPLRQQTMQAAIAWSYDMLPDQEQHLFDAVSVFVGGFGREQAEIVDDSVTDTIESLSGLVTRSMVQLESVENGSVRYHVLEPLRQFGRKRLRQRGQLENARRRHARASIEVMDHLAGELEGPRQLEAFRRLDVEWDNLRAALDWSEEDGDAELALRLVAPLWICWTRPDRRAEGRARLERVLSIPGVEAHPRELGRVLGIAASLAAGQADVGRATTLLDQALAIARNGRDDWLQALLLLLDGQLRLFARDLHSAEGALREALDLAQRAGVRQLEVLASIALANVAMSRGELASAEEGLRFGLRVAETARDLWSEAMLLNALGTVLQARGDIEGATAAYARALPMLEAMNGGDPPEGVLHNMAYAALARGDVPSAVKLFLDSARRYRTSGADRRGVAECVIGLGGCAVAMGRCDLAARLFGAADAALDQLGTSMTISHHAEYDHARAELATLLDGKTLAGLHAEGRRLSLEHALELTNELAGQAAPHLPTATVGPTAELTVRELEVAELLANGLRNRQIAERLVITEKTAANHVQRVLDKLGLQSRAQVAARAAELGLQRLA